MDQFADRHGFIEDVILYEDFMDYMVAMDSEYTAVCREEILKNIPKGKK